jgi:hypothetical protein
MVKVEEKEEVVVHTLNFCAGSPIVTAGVGCVGGGGEEGRDGEAVKRDGCEEEEEEEEVEEWEEKEDEQWEDGAKIKV